MAMITADQINYSDSGDFSVGFFSLKNDGDEAIVRIMCDSMSDLEIMTVHPITLGASSFPNRQVNCLRDPRDPMDLCPLCAAGESVKQKVFIRMLQYDPATKQPKAVVWDRVASVFAPMIKSYLDNYGPLSHIMCKIIRHGTGKQTKYDIVPNINPQEYNETNYPIDYEAFKDFKVLGRMVMDKNAEEIMQFMRTGAFPETSNQQTTSQQQYTQQTYQQPYNQGYQQQYQQSTQQLTPDDIPFNNPNMVSPNQQQAVSDQNMSQPVRY